MGHLAASEGRSKRISKARMTMVCTGYEELLRVSEARMRMYGRDATYNAEDKAGSELVGKEEV